MDEKIVTSVTDKIGFINAGYWKGVEDSVELAQINLIETLVSFLSRRNGNILDVACGNGASSKFLTKYFNAESITGIDTSEKRLQMCKLVAPECDFRLMDATKLALGDSSFDNVLCIASAYTFMTRYKFFEEAYRVLKCGGRLAVSDTVMHKQDPPLFRKRNLPVENQLPNLDAYRENLFKVGLKHVRVEDYTEFGINALLKFIIRKAEREFGNKEDYTTLETLMSLQQHHGWTWCMAYAIK